MLNFSFSDVHTQWGVLVMISEMRYQGEEWSPKHHWQGQIH
jgi:hypothetical protein